METSIDGGADASPAGNVLSLIDAAVHGDAEAFRRVVEPHLAIAVRAATAIIGTETDALDVVQEALRAAWQDLHKLRDRRAFPAWFRQIVVRGALRRARSRAVVLELHADVREIAPAPGLDRAIEHRELARAFATLVVAIEP